MDWIFIGVIAGMITSGGFPTEEACLGKKAVWERDHKVTALCVKVPHQIVYGTYIYPGTSCLNCNTLNTNNGN